MKKIPTIFKRNPDNMKELLNEQHPDCKWVFDGEGVATRKYDGTCVKIEGGKYFKRREVKKDGAIPEGFIEENLDPNTGKRMGWVEVEPTDKDNKWHMEAWDLLVKNMDLQSFNATNATLELMGPKIQGNPECLDIHVLHNHSRAEQYENVPRTFEGIKEWLKGKDIEGVVFHHPDGRMGKIKKRDFGMWRCE